MDITDYDIDLLVPNYELCLKLHKTGLFYNSKLAVSQESDNVFYFDRKNHDNICAPMLCEILDVLFNIIGKTNIHLDTMIYGTKCNSLRLDTLNPYFFQDKNIHVYFDGKGSFFTSICEILFKAYEEVNKIK